METTALIFLGGVCIGALSTFIYTQLQKIKQKQKWQEELNLLKAKLFESETLRSAQKQSVIEKTEQLKEIEKKFENIFKALSSEALQNNNKYFMDFAKTTFEKMQESAKCDLSEKEKTIKDLVTPIKQSLEKFDEKVIALEKAREGAYVGLTEQVKNLLSNQLKLENETANLVKALRAPNVRGQWGELQLRRTVELAGMLNQVDFLEQINATTEEGRQRPDMIINLPNGKKVIVDAKAPLAAYLEALEAKQPQEQLLKLKDHARQIKDHLQKLGSKQYWKQFEPTPEFVVLFLPGEMFFSAALEQDPTLIEFGTDHRVILATPTTLIALLKTVFYGWKQEAIALDAKEISNLGATLYDRMNVLAEHFLEIRKGLDRSVCAYNKAVNSMETRVLPTARKFKELHSIGDQAIPELAIIDTSLTHPKADELLVTESIASNN